MYIAFTKRNIALILLAAGVCVAIYVYYFRGLTGRRDEEVFELYASGNPVAEGEILRRGDRVSTDVLVKMLKHDKVKVRRLAAKQLDRPGEKAAVLFLGLALQDEDPVVRKNAVRSLEAIGDRSAVPFLIGALDDQEREVAGAVGRALRTVTGETMIHGRDGWRNWWELKKDSWEEESGTGDDST